MNNYSFLISNQTVSVTFANGETKVINRTHPQVSEILDALSLREDEGIIRDLFSRILAVKRYMHGLVSVSEDGEVTYAGKELNHVVGNKIVEFMKQGLPYEPLVKFLDKLMGNPSYRSVESLYDFLVNQDITIDAEGNLVCYKAVTRDYLDKHTGKIDNRPGCVVQMPRNEIDDDPNSACSQGLHAGSIKYVKGFACGDDKIVMVKIHPADVVSVPHDCDATKMRVSRYEVLVDVTDKVITEKARSAMYTGPDYDDPVVDDDDYDDDYGDDTLEDGDDPMTETEINGVTVRTANGADMTVETIGGKTVVTVHD